MHPTYLLYPPSCCKGDAVFLFFFFFLDSRGRVSLSSPGHPGTHSVTWLALNSEIYLCLPRARIKYVCHHHPARLLLVLLHRLLDWILDINCNKNVRKKLKTK